MRNSPKKNEKKGVLLYPSFFFTFTDSKINYLSFYNIFMKSKLRIYLDTSVISAVFDQKHPERQSLTKYFFKMKDVFKIFISELTQLEINQFRIGLLKIFHHHPN